MADWKASLSRFAQTAANKGKEIAEVTRINMEISNAEQKIKKAHLDLGVYVAEHLDLLTVQDETVAAILQTVSETKAEIENLKQTLLDVRNVRLCTACGAEVDRDSKFCSKCGAHMEEIVPEEETVETADTCSDYIPEQEVEEETCADCIEEIEE